MRRNVLKRREQGREASRVGAEDANEHLEHRNAFADLTDRENPDCKYHYLDPVYDNSSCNLTVRYVY